MHIDLFGKDSPISLRENPERLDYDKIPLLNLAKYLLQLAETPEGISLVQDDDGDNVIAPEHVIKFMQQHGYSPYYIPEPALHLVDSEEGIESDEDLMPLHMAHILLDLGGLIKNENGTLRITGKGKELQSDNHKLLQHLFLTHIEKLNWSYFDFGDDDDFGKLGLGFSFICISKYGGKKRNSSFYLNKYVKAFPWLWDTEDVPKLYKTEAIKKAYYIDWYGERIFTNFLELFGLVSIEYYEAPFGIQQSVQRTPLFHKLLKVQPHKEF